MDLIELKDQNGKLDVFVKPSEILSIRRLEALPADKDRGEAVPERTRIDTGSGLFLVQETPHAIKSKMTLLRAKQTDAALHDELIATATAWATAMEEDTNDKITAGKALIDVCFRMAHAGDDSAQK